MTHTARAMLDAMEHLPLVAFDDLGVRSLVVVAPHPDDESLGCGGLIATARAHGVPVEIIIVSDGTGSHPNSRAYPPARLKALREDEARAAAAELGVEAGAVHFLGLPDRFVPSEGPDAASAVAVIADILRAAAADLVTITWQHDPHCDHQASFRLTRAACRTAPGARLLCYPVWGATLPPDQLLEGALPCGVRLDVRDHLAQKARAVAAHRSQILPLIADDPEGFTLSPDDLARFARPFEIYLETEA